MKPAIHLRKLNTALVLLSTLTFSLGDSINLTPSSKFAFLNFLWPFPDPQLPAYIIYIMHHPFSTLKSLYLSVGSVVHDLCTRILYIFSLEFWRYRIIKMTPALSGSIKALLLYPFDGHYRESPLYIHWYERLCIWESMYCKTDDYNNIFMNLCSVNWI